MHAQMPPSTEQFIRLINIIAAAIVASVFVYMVIAWVVAPTLAEESRDPGLVQTLAAILAVVSLGHLVAAQILFAIRVRAAEKLPTPEQRLGSYRAAIILSFALREAVAVYGLILSFLSGDARWCLGFGAVAVVSMLLGWPNRGVMDRLGSEVPPIG